MKRLGLVILGVALLFGCARNIHRYPHKVGDGGYTLEPPAQSSGAAEALDVTVREVVLAYRDVGSPGLTPELRVGVGLDASSLSKPTALSVSDFTLSREWPGGEPFSKAPIACDTMTLTEDDGLIQETVQLPAGSKKVIWVRCPRGMPTQYISEMGHTIPLTVRLHVREHTVTLAEPKQGGPVWLSGKLFLRSGYNTVFKYRFTDDQSESLLGFQIATQLGYDAWALEIRAALLSGQRSGASGSDDVSVDDAWLTRGSVEVLAGYSSTNMNLSVRPEFLVGFGADEVLAGTADEFNTYLIANANIQFVDQPSPYPLADPHWVSGLRLGIFLQQDVTKAGAARLGTTIGLQSGFMWGGR